jgi:hypothetical protein
MITTLIICGTILLCLVILLKWIADMSRACLPMFTYGECVWKDSTEEPKQMGSSAEEEKSVDKKSDKEIKDAIMADPITMTAALLRGEVDIDELTTRN